MAVNGLPFNVIYKLRLLITLNRTLSLEKIEEGRQGGGRRRRIGIPMLGWLASLVVRHGKAKSGQMHFYTSRRGTEVTKGFSLRHSLLFRPHSPCLWSVLIGCESSQKTTEDDALMFFSLRRRR